MLANLATLQEDTLHQRHENMSVNKLAADQNNNFSFYWEGKSLLEENCMVDKMSTNGQLLDAHPWMVIGRPLEQPHPALNYVCCCDCEKKDEQVGH